MLAKRIVTTGFCFLSTIIIMILAIQTVSIAEEETKKPEIPEGWTVLPDVPYSRQPDGSTCMPTSLLMALDYFDKDKLSDERIFELHRRTRVNRLNIPAILRDYGLEGIASYSPYWTFDDIKEDIDDGLPFIMGTDISDVGHIVLAVGYTDDGRVVVHDPGRSAVGYVAKTLEEWVFDGGGVRFRKIPKGPYQAEWVSHRYRSWIVEGRRQEASVEYRNIGEKAWPAGKVEFRLTGNLSDKPSFYDPESWVSETCIARLDSDVEPGQTYRLEFSYLAPDVDLPTPLYFPFHPFLSSGEPFSFPQDQDIGLDVRVWPIYAKPAVDTFPPEGPQLGWQKKFTEPQLVERVDDPSGDGVVLRVLDQKEGGYDSIRVGNLDEGDYRVSATLYCKYRPDLAYLGFERIGLFARDRYNGGFEKKGSGNCYLITYDSSDGRLRCGKSVSGELIDLLPEEMFWKQSGWHEFAITCKDKKITYALDGKVVLDTEDDFRSEGQAGIGYHEYFDNNTLAEGTLVARFKLEDISDL